MSLLTITADLSSVAKALWRIVEILEIVYRAELEPPSTPPKPKPGGLFVQTTANLLELEVEDARRAGYVENWDDRTAREEDTEGAV